MDKVTVIQADRNFAADYQLARGRINQNDHERICQGLWDETDDVAAVARFRLSLATPAPDSEKLREAHDGLVETADYLIECYQRLWRGGIVRDLAEAEGAYQAAKDFMALTLGATS